jgi:L-alanine-DL-glutamate epimerase-like enolase superfamily enzyme
VKITFSQVDLQLVHPWSIARTSGMKKSQVVVVRLEAADGTVGLGEAAPISRYKESIKIVEAFIRTVDPRGLSFADVHGSMEYLATLSRHDMAAKCALNIALIDGAARRAGKPVHDYLGLGFREGQHLTSFTIGIDAPDIIRKKVIEAAAYPVLKMKMGVPEDHANLKALREVAPDRMVRVDANEGWKTKEAALEHIEWLAKDGRVELVEQPLPATAPARDWIWLKERSPLPIFADESYHLASDVQHVAAWVHGVNVKLVKTGGITAGFEALKAARAVGLKTMLGCMIETSILISAGAHLAELCDYLDLDGNILTANDPYRGVECENGLLTFRHAPQENGLRVSQR